jgi:Yippee zinc-binding/DNA-binding /Mis18, centromere assembly
VGLERKESSRSSRSAIHKVSCRPEKWVRSSKVTIKKVIKYKQLPCYQLPHHSKCIVSFLGLPVVRVTCRDVPQQESQQADGNVCLIANGNKSSPSATASSEMTDHESPAPTPTMVTPMPTVKHSSKHMGHRSPRPSPLSKRRVRAHSFAGTNHQPTIPCGNNQGSCDANAEGSRRLSLPTTLPRSQSDRQVLLSDSMAKIKSREALRMNDSMVYLDGPQVYTCAQCRTHMTSHDDIISKSFHGRHGRAYLFDQCVNVTIGPSEDRRLITGMHTVSDIFCKRCKSLVGWTYLKAYESSQKYKEGKYIIEKINLHIEESDYYTFAPPAGERTDRWRQRSMSWGGENYKTTATPVSSPGFDKSTIIFEYQPSIP